MVCREGRKIAGAIFCVAEDMGCWRFGREGYDWGLPRRTENHSRDFPCLVIRIIQPATELLAEAASAARSSA